MGRRPAGGREREFGRAVAAELRAAREEAGLSVAEVTATTTCGSDAIYAMEAGRVLSPGFFTVVEIAHRLGLDIADVARAGLAATAAGGESTLSAAATRKGRTS